MKRLAVLLAVLSAATARGQIEVSLVLPEKLFMTGERVPAVVTIKNNTSAEVPVGGTGGHTLEFDVKNADGHPVSERAGHPPVTRTLPAGGSLTITNDLFLCFELLDQRQVGVAAVVGFQNRNFVSKREYFDLQQGAELARFQVNVGERTVSQTLRTVMRKEHTHLFLRADDEAGGTTFGAVHLGTLLRTTPPQYMVDRQNKTHIVHRSGPEQFIYHVANSDGGLVRREHFTGDYKIVRLVAGSDGQVTCTGLPGDKKDEPQILQQTPFRPDLHRDFKPR